MIISIIARCVKTPSSNSNFRSKYCVPGKVYHILKDTNVKYAGNSKVFYRISLKDLPDIEKWSEYQILKEEEFRKCFEIIA